MKAEKKQRIARAVIGGLVGLAIVATAFVAGGSTAQAQVTRWEKIKFPELREFKVPEPERFTMSNGITVLLIEDHELPLIEMDVRVRTGSRLEPAEMAVRILDGVSVSFPGREHEAIECLLSDFSVDTRYGSDEYRCEAVR